MKNKISLFSKLLLCVGLLLAVCSIFCFLGDALKISSDEVDLFTYYTVFSFIFGGKLNVDTGTSIDVKTAPMVPILMVMFVFVLIAVIFAAITIVAMFIKKLDSKKVLALVCVVSVSMLVAAVLALVSKNPILKATGEDPSELPDYIKTSLGSGLITFGILSLISVAINVTGVIIQKKSA